MTILYNTMYMSLYIWSEQLLTLRADQLSIEGQAFLVILDTLYKLILIYKTWLTVHAV